MLNLISYNRRLPNWHEKTRYLRKSYLFLSSRVFKFCIYWKSFQEPCFKQICEKLQSQLNSSHFFYNLNEPNRKYSKSNWWQQDPFKSRHSLEKDTTFCARKTIHNYNLLATGRRSDTSEVAGFCESTRDDHYSHNSMKRKVRQPLCDLKKFQNAK